MAKREIGTVLKIDGEAQFKSALNNINQELRVLSSEMGASMSAFDKNATSMDALKTKSEIYGKEIEAQKSKLEVLEQAIAAESR